jgi:phosphopantothenoylcysteine decarboxylase/phosphopantothenate--cysteine ligase
VSRNYRFLIAITGSISAYRVADLISSLTKQGHQVQCIATPSAEQFITPTVVETLSHRPLISSLFGPGVSGTEHIRLARWPDAIIVAPATAHSLAKLALGLADDLPTTVILASQAPLVIAPAMNSVMWSKPATLAHVAELKAQGATVVEPEGGILACGEVGTGKLASVADIQAAALLAAQKATHVRGDDLDLISAQSSPSNGQGSLKGERFLITAGPTRSHWDAVRYLTNPSTGKMGAALAEEALAQGATVDYILGVDSGVVRPIAPRGSESRLRICEVLTAEEMLDRALENLSQATVVAATAAVLDYEFAQSQVDKEKRGEDPVTVTLVPSVDVLKSLREHPSAQGVRYWLGFAAQTPKTNQNLLELGKNKLKSKRLDLVFANAVASQGQHLDTGFATETNAGWLIGTKSDHDATEIPLQTKAEVAARILERVAQDLKT